MMAECIEREDALWLVYSGQIITGDRAEKSARELIESIPAADVQSVVLCRDCYWWTKQEASMQGRCSCLGMYPTGNWYCANGQKRVEES